MIFSTIHSRNHHRSLLSAEPSFFQRYGKTEKGLVYPCVKGANEVEQGNSRELRGCIAIYAITEFSQDGTSALPLG